VLERERSQPSEKAAANGRVAEIRAWRDLAPRLGFGSKKRPRPPALLMDDHVHPVDEQFDRGRSRVTRLSGMIEAGRKAREVRCRQRRRAIYTPRPPGVAADFQLQAHRRLASMQDAVRQDESKAKHQNSDSNAHQDEKGSDQFNSRLSPRPRPPTRNARCFWRMPRDAASRHIHERHCQTPVPHPARCC
jgi:hypothetical protein